MLQEITFETRDPKDNLGYLLWQTQMQWQREANKALKEVELTHSQYIILVSLAWLLRSSPMVTQKEISRHIETDKMMVSKGLRALQKQGLVNRKEHPEDTRAKCVSLTQKGATTLQKAIHLKSQSNARFFQGLEDRTHFSEELKTLIIRHEQSTNP